MLRNANAIGTPLGIRKGKILTQSRESQRELLSLLGVLESGVGFNAEAFGVWVSTERSEPHKRSLEWCKAPATTLSPLLHGLSPLVLRDSETPPSESNLIPLRVSRLSLRSAWSLPYGSRPPSGGGYALKTTSLPHSLTFPLTPSLKEKTAAGDIAQ